MDIRETGYEGIMTCLWCQKQPEDHTLKDIQFCLQWITKQHGIRSEQLRKARNHG